MIWQDILIGSAQAMLAIALLPAVFHDHKPPVATSLVTALGMAAFAIAFASLGLWWSTGMSLVQLVLWSILAFQKFRAGTSEAGAER